MAIDLSQSMATGDFERPDGSVTDRLSAVRMVVDEFITKRRDDRIGLLVFGDRAFVQANPTKDHATVRRLLADLRTGLAGSNTAIGDGIGLSISMMEDSHQNQKILILLTDGKDTASRLSPLQAAEIAKRKRVQIHTIAVGRLGSRGDEEVDAESLTEIAESTGGQFFMASDAKALESVYDTLDGLTPHETETLSFQPKVQWFWVPVLLALVVLIVFFLNEIVGAANRNSPQLGCGEPDDRG
ncbi:VWA domain-containing protein [Marinobacter litoralis]|uniref:VWA domain-containing protein n=1 Tax=Marinobacter litoralis TaxID=187981 RepID=UPI0018EB2CCB|nr:VWA domain-containing protein [Marinobacter litoralis]MBJ6138491.1 VWA domain-containing protein [Marinobacter litoralis]